jgi:hypothetical protein
LKTSWLRGESPVVRRPAMKWEIFAVLMSFSVMPEVLPHLHQMTNEVF